MMINFSGMGMNGSMVCAMMFTTLIATTSGSWLPSQKRIKSLEEIRRKALDGFASGGSHSHIISKPKIKPKKRGRRSSATGTGTGSNLRIRALGGTYPKGNLYKPSRGYSTPRSRPRKRMTNGIGPRRGSVIGARKSAARKKSSGKDVKSKQKESRRSNSVDPRKLSSSVKKLSRRQPRRRKSVHVHVAPRSYEQPSSKSEKKLTRNNASGSKKSTRNKSGGPYFTKKSLHVGRFAAAGFVQRHSGTESEDDTATAVGSPVTPLSLHVPTPRQEAEDNGTEEAEIIVEEKEHEVPADRVRSTLSEDQTNPDQTEVGVHETWIRETLKGYRDQPEEILQLEFPGTYRIDHGDFSQYWHFQWLPEEELWQVFEVEHFDGEDLRLYPLLKEHFKMEDDDLYSLFWRNLELFPESDPDFDTVAKPHPFHVVGWNSEYGCYFRWLLNSKEERRISSDDDSAVSKPRLPMIKEDESVVDFS